MPDATNALHTLAMSGIYLDIFERITPCWMHQGLELAQGEVRGVFKVWSGATLRCSPQLQPACCEGMLTGMPLETQITQTRRGAMSSDPQIRNGCCPQALIQEIATRRYFGHGGAWTGDVEQATDFRSAAAAMEQVQQLNFVMVQLVLSGNLTVCEVIPSTTAASA